MKTLPQKLQRAIVEAIGFMELDLFQSAEKRLDKVSEQGRPCLQWNLLMAEVLRSQEAHERALPFLEQACELAPEQIDIYLNLGWCYKRSNQLRLAIRALESAHRLQPESDIVLYNLACYHALAGHKRDALWFLRQALTRSDRWRFHAMDETDFAPLRDDPDFEELIDGHSNTATC